MRDNSKLTDALDYYYKADYKTAITELEEKLSIAVNDSDTANIYYWLGECYYSLEQYQKSIDMYKQANTLQPDVILYQVSLGAGYFKNNQPNQANELWDKITPDDLKSADDYYAYGSILLHKQNYTESITYFRHALILDSKYIFAYNKLGNVYSELKQYDNAITDYTQAIKINSNYKNAYYNRGNVYSELKQYDNAIADFTQAIKINPEDADAYHNRGYAYDELKQYDNAIADYTQAIKINHEYAFAYYNRGYAYDELKQYDNAIADYTQAIKINPEYANTYYNRGYAYYLRKQYDDAEKDCIKALELEPNNQNAKNLQSLIETKRDAQKTLAVSKQEFDKLAGQTNTLTNQLKDEIKHIKAEMDSIKILKDTTENLKKEIETIRDNVVTNATAQGISEAYDKQGKKRYAFYEKLQYLEWAIYAVIIVFSCIFMTSDFAESIAIKNMMIMIDFMNAESFTEKFFFITFLKITFLIPIIFLIISINSTAKQLRIRSEFDSDTAVQWLFYKKIEIELKTLKDTEGENSDYYKSVYKEFLDKHIALRSKTNFELLHDVLQKKSKEKSISTKQISDGLDILQKAKDILTPPDDKKTP